MWVDLLLVLALWYAISGALVVVGFLRWHPVLMGDETPFILFMLTLWVAVQAFVAFTAWPYVLYRGLRGEEGPLF